MFNLNYRRNHYNQNRAAKIIGFHVMIVAVVFFVLPFIFNQLKEVQHYKFIQTLIGFGSVSAIVISMWIQLNTKAKLTKK